MEATGLKSTDIFRNISFLMTFIEMITTGYTTFLLFYCTPIQMKQIKWYLINMHFWTRFLDILYSFLIVPYYFIPSLVVYPIGFLSIINVPTDIQMIILVISISGLGSAVIMIFENRYNAIRPTNSIAKFSKRKIYHFMNFFIGFVLLIVPFSNLSDQQTAKNEYLKLLDCPIPEYFHSSARVYKPKNDKLLTYCGFGFAILISFQVMYFTLVSFYYLYSLEQRKMSQATRKLQRKFFLTALLQLLIHLIAIVIPMGYCFFSFLMTYHNQYLINLSTLVVTLHGTITSISMIIINRPYYKYSKQLLLPKTAHRNSVKINLLTTSSSWF